MDKHISLKVLQCKEQGFDFTSRYPYSVLHFYIFFTAAFVNRFRSFSTDKLRILWDYLMSDNKRNKGIEMGKVEFIILRAYGLLTIAGLDSLIK